MSVQIVRPKPYLAVVKKLFSKSECDGLIDRAYMVENDGMNKSWHKADTGGHYDRVIL
jgi:hypothetical protein